MFHPSSFLTFNGYFIVMLLDSVRKVKKVEIECIRKIRKVDHFIVNVGPQVKKILRFKRDVRNDKMLNLKDA